MFGLYFLNKKYNIAPLAEISGTFYLGDLDRSAEASITPSPGSLPVQSANHSVWVIDARASRLAWGLGAASN